MEDAGQPCEEVQFHDVVKMPPKKSIMGKEDKEPIKAIQDWKSQLEGLYNDKEQRAAMLSSQAKKFR